jgi:hypothetical protein
MFTKSFARFFEGGPRQAGCRRARPLDESRGRGGVGWVRLVRVAKLPGTRGGLNASGPCSPIFARATCLPKRFHAKKFLRITRILLRSESARIWTSKSPSRSVPSRGDQPLGHLRVAGRNTCVSTWGGCWLGSSDNSGSRRPIFAGGFLVASVPGMPALAVPKPHAFSNAQRPSSTPPDHSQGIHGIGGSDGNMGMLGTVEPPQQADHDSPTDGHTSGGVGGTVAVEEDR